MLTTVFQTSLWYTKFSPETLPFHKVWFKLRGKNNPLHIFAVFFFFPPQHQSSVKVGIFIKTTIHILWFIYAKWMGNVN